MGARDTDPVEIPIASGILLLGLPQDARLARVGGTDPQAMFGRLRDARIALHDPIIAEQLRRLAARAHVQLPTGLDTADALIDAVGVALLHRAIIGMFLARVPMGPPVAAPAPKPAPSSVPAFAGMSAEQRIRLLLERTPKELAPDLARAFRSLVTVEALAGIAAGFVVLLAAQFVGVGEIADAALAWWAYSQAGFSGLAGLYEVVRAVVAAVRAENEGAFDQAVKRFAEGLTLVGVALLTVVVARAARKRAGTVETDTAGSADLRPDPATPAPRPRAIAGATAARPAETPIYVLGRQADTAVAKDWPSHSILDIPDWTIAKNDAFVQNIIDQRATVYLGSPQTEATLWDSVNSRMTVFARELGQLRAAGYNQVGDYMYPPPNY